MKIIELTPKGRRTWQQVQDLMYSPPPEILEGGRDLRALLRTSERITALATRQNQDATGPGQLPADQRQDRRRGRAGRRKSRPANAV